MPHHVLARLDFAIDALHNTKICIPQSGMIRSVLPSFISQGLAFSMDSSLAYQYQPLLEEDAIRLLILQPSKDLQGRVECSLLHTTLSECDDDVVDHYTALSYVWGDAMDIRSILVDGKDFNITVNLESALRHLRDSSRARKVWADAICIDQANATERAQQVEQMGEVYKYARHTIIYLGEPTQESDRLLQHIRSSFKMPGNLIEAPPMDEGNRIESLLGVLNRPWFKRVWVFQELILSNDPWVQCGGTRVRWDHLCRIIENTAGLDSSADPLQTFLSMDAKRKDLRAQSAVPTVGKAALAKLLFEILESRRGLGVRDPRDMLFAHLGIALGRIPDRKKLVNVDYTKSQRQVYEDLAKFLLESSKSFEVLSHAEASHGIDSRVGDLPSWIPNWILRPPPHPYSRLRHAFSLDHRDRSDKEDQYAYLTSKHYSNLSSRFPSPNHVLASPSILACAGYFVGTISNVSRVITSDQASWNIRNSGLASSRTSGETQSPNENSFQEAWPYVYNHWRDILGPLMEENGEELSHDLGKDFEQTSPLPVYWEGRPRTGSTISNGEVEDFAQEQINNSKPDYDYLAFWEHMCKGVPRTANLKTLVKKSTFGLERCRHLKTGGIFDFIGCRKLAIHLFLHAIHQSDENYHHFFCGRKFALLDNNTLCLVPGSATRGDSVCSLIGDLRIPFVLRPKRSDTISAAASLDNGIRLKLKSFDGAPISHCTLVGESFVEGWMFGEKFTELIKKHSWKTPLPRKYGDWKNGEGKLFNLQIFVVH